MNFARLHGWNLTPKEAVQLQRSLANQVDTRTPLTNYRYIAGADVSYRRFSDRMFAAVVVYDRKTDAIIETQSHISEMTFPYVPGLLSFRESPPLLEVFRKVESRVDVVMIDGQGYAHPRRFGIACHLGLWLGLPTIGCAKTRLIGEYKEPKPKKGATSPLEDKGETIGMVVRTRDAVKPLFISVGHRIDLASAVRVVLECCRGYRLPEPTRQAHLAVNAFRRRWQALPQPPGESAARAE